MSNTIEQAMLDEMIAEVTGRFKPRERLPIEAFLRRAVFGWPWRKIANWLGSDVCSTFWKGQEGRKILDAAIARGEIDREELAETLSRYVP
jgi:hypothetical protein